MKLFTLTIDIEKMPYDSYPKKTYRIIGESFKEALEKLCKATKYTQYDVLYALTAVTSESHNPDTDLIS